MPAALIGLHCRTSDRSAAGERGVSELEVLVGKRLGREARAIGTREPPSDGNWDADLRDSRGCLLEAGGQVEDAIGGGNVPVLLAADCSIAVTTLPTVARLRPGTKILWLDAHGDFNTPETTTSGYLGGMGLAAACGRWDAGLVDGAVDPADVVLAGVRALDGEERRALEASAATVVGSSPVETLVAVSNALDRAPVYVHLDLDVLDPAIMPAAFPEPGGLSPDKLLDVLEAVVSTSPLVGVEITAFEAPADEEERQEAAATILRALEPLLAAIPDDPTDGGSRSALEGLKILDLTRLLPGGYCTALLADLGADVLKVEDTGMGDYVRWAPPYYDGVEESSKSALYVALNRGKRSIRLNLKDPAGREALLRLVDEYDVLVEGFRPGVMDRLGVGYDALAERNPKLVYCAITGYGQTGPYVNRSGHDMNYLGLIGMLDMQGAHDGPPTQGAGQVADLGGGGLMAAYAILAAVRSAERTGEGQMVDVSMADGALTWLTMVAGKYLADDEQPRRGGESLTGGFVCYRPYACADGYVTMGALEPKFWGAWCAGVGREDLMDKAFEKPGSEAHRQVEEVFASRTRAEWKAFADEHDCCLEPVLDLGEALESDLVREREMVVEVDQPGATEPVRQLGHPVRFTGTPADATRPGPGIGQHTADVLGSLGYSEAEIAELEEAGAVAGPPEGSLGTFMA